MKKILCAIVVCLATLAWTQTSSGQGQTGSTSKSQTSGATKKGTGATLTGCLSGPNDEGVYELKTKGSKTAIEVGGLDDMSKHVGHEVKLHGSWVKSGADIGEKESAEKPEKGEAQEKHFKVTSIDHVADTCPPAGASKSGGQKSKPAPSPKPGS